MALPDLQLRHIRDMPLGCKMITVYEDSIEEYQTFLTPEASSVLDNYFDQRRKSNENLTDKDKGKELFSLTSRGLVEYEKIKEKFNL